MIVEMKKISLVLSGGAARGAYHLGVLEALENLNIEVCEISGASIGAIIGASYLSGKSPCEIFDFFAQGKFKKLLKTNILKGTLFKMDFNNKLIFELIEEKYKNIEDLPKLLYISIVNIQDGKVEYKNSGDIRTIVCASSSLYPVFSPIKIDQNTYVDGGVIDNFPIEPIKNSKHAILGVNLHPNLYKPKQLLLARIGFLAWHVAGMEEKIKRCNFYLTNKELSNHFILKTKNIDKLFKMGYDDASLLFKDIKA